MKITTGKLNLRIFGSNANPEGQIIARIGEICLTDEGGVGKIYQKATGDNTTTGWVERGGGGSSGVQVPIKFRGVNGQQTYSVPELVPGAVVDMIFVDAGPQVENTYSAGVGSLNINGVAFAGGEYVVVLWHLT